MAVSSASAANTADRWPALYVDGRAFAALQNGTLLQVAVEEKLPALSTASPLFLTHAETGEQARVFISSAREVTDAAGQRLGSVVTLQHGRFVLSDLSAEHHLAYANGASGRP